MSGDTILSSARLRRLRPDLRAASDGLRALVGFPGVLRP